MSDCMEYRRHLLTDPHHPSDAMRTHLATCGPCSGYTERLMRFEGRLEQALRVAADTAGERTASAGSVRLHGRSRRVRRGFAIAASVLVVVVMAGGVWLGSAGRSLAADVVNHMAEEPDAWSRTDVAVPPLRLEQVLAQSDLRLKPGAAMVSYASSCMFRGHRVPHLVVQSGEGPVTVMVLTHDPVHVAAHFNEQGYRGMIIPVRNHGSLAVLERDAHADPEAMQEVASRVLAAIEWMPATAP